MLSLIHAAITSRYKSRGRCLCRHSPTTYLNITGFLRKGDRIRCHNQYLSTQENNIFLPLNEVPIRLLVVKKNIHVWLHYVGGTWILKP